MPSPADAHLVFSRTDVHVATAKWWFAVGMRQGIFAKGRAGYPGVPKGFSRWIYGMSCSEMTHTSWVFHISITSLEGYLRSKLCEIQDLNRGSTGYDWASLILHPRVEIGQHGHMECKCEQTEIVFHSSCLTHFLLTIHQHCPQRLECFHV